MELKDKNGMTEQEYIEAYKSKNYPRPYLTADMVIIRKENNSVLLIKRKGHPFMGRFAFPGGFAESGETIEESAARELKEETNLDGISAGLIGIYSKPGRDPRGWVVTAAFLAVIEGEPEGLKAQDDAADAGWFEMSGEGDNLILTKGSTVISVNDLAFDHGEILKKAIEMMK